MDTASLKAHSEHFVVRDYECDVQGIVNNAVYLNYLEHARHEFLRSVGINFAELAKAGVNLVMVRVELDYHASLRPGDRFVVATNAERVSRLRIVFLQQIRRADDEKVVVSGKSIATAVNGRGRPILPESINTLFPL